MQTIPVFGLQIKLLSGSGYGGGGGRRARTPDRRRRSKIIRGGLKNLRSRRKQRCTGRRGGFGKSNQHFALTQYYSDLSVEGSFVLFWLEINGKQGKPVRQKAAAKSNETKGIRQ